MIFALTTIIVSNCTNINSIISITGVDPTGKCQSTHPEISISFNSTNTAAAAGNGDDDGQDDLNNDLDDDGQ